MDLVPRLSIVLSLGDFGAAVGCGKILGVDGYAPGATAQSKHETPDAASCGNFRAPKACLDCIAADPECCQAAADCRADAECEAFFECTGSCAPDDGVCLHDKCFSKHPKTQRIGKYLGCTYRSCANSCFTPESWGAPFGSDCGQCFGSYASDKVLACFDDSECAAYAGCFSEKCLSWTQDPACRVACMEEHPGASKPFRDLAFAVASCTAACGWGRFWGCLGADGQPQLPNGAGNERTRLTLALVSASTAAPQSKVAVTPFRNFDPPPRLDSTRTTGDDGVAEFDLPVSLSGTNESDDYFQVEWSDGGVALVYPGMSWARPTAHLTVSVDEHPAPPTKPLTPGHALVSVSLADCLGATDVTATAARSGVTFELDGSSAPRYLGISPDASLQSWPSATFDVPSPGAPQTLRAFHTGSDGSRRLVTSINVRTIADSVTWVYLNYPVNEY